MSKKDEDGGDSSEKKKKWYKKKNNKNQGGSAKEIVKCESKVSPAYIPREEEDNPAKEIAAKDSTDEETQFQDL